MERRTVEVYEERGPIWASSRRPVRRDEARAFAALVPTGGIRIDLGCGGGRYTADLGRPVVGLDAAASMLELCRAAAPAALLVRGDLEALPFGAGTLQGGWANMSYLHLPRTRLPMALADLQGVLAPGAPVDLQVLAGDHEGFGLPGDDVGGRFFSGWQPDALEQVLVGAGFGPEPAVVEDDVVRVRARRLRSLADTVGAGMGVLVVGLNPSLHAADSGVGFSRPGNRFWPAARTAGLVTRDRDPRGALSVDGVGMTDLVKRATTTAAELGGEEYGEGMARLEGLVGWLEPGVVCFVGLAGWRAAVDRGARAGLQEGGLGGRPVYLMPSTSGLNAGSSLDELTGHLRAVIALAREGGR